MQTIDELLEEIDVFRGLPDEHLDLIAGCALNRVFGAGEQLLREGEPANDFFAIRHGTVALETFVPQRGAVTIETLHRGDVLGWSWLVDDRDLLDRFGLLARRRARHVAQGRQG
jgi:CRP/FNR family cyclic AMP-dependent transcriptional regulator